MPVSRKFLPIGLFLLLSSLAAEAHIKWFEPFDITTAPKPIGDVLSSTYIAFFLGSILVIYSYFWVDRFLYRRRFMADAINRIVDASPTSLNILRTATFLFFVSLFLYGWYGHTFLLTPELTTDDRIVKWLHLTIAITALRRATTPLIGVCLIILWLMTVADYGLYHALDYIVFIGLAAFFLTSTVKSAALTKVGSVIMFALLGLNLGWLAIEKWAFPQWTYPMLERNPGLLFGIPKEPYMIFAGFVEFNIAFIMLGSVSTFSRASALVLASIFILAISQFGLIDAVGHLFIIAILLILVLRGPTTAREFMAISHKSIWAEAYFMTGLYTLAFVLIFLSYYGLHHVFYGN